MATVQVAIVNQALGVLEEIELGESPSAEESADALTALLAMVDGWKLHALLAYARREETVTLLANTVSRTIGPTGNLVTARPLEILKAWILDNGITYEVRVIEDDAYGSISDKASAGDWPTHLNYKATHPDGTIYVWPVQNANRSLRVLVKIPLATLALTDTLAVPPGYEEAMVYNLAKRLAPKCGKRLSAEAADIARDSLAAIKRQNQRPLRHSSEVARLVGNGHAGNIISGQ